MKQGPLIGVQACVFDAYGTLFDFAAAARGCRDALGDNIDKLTALWRDTQLHALSSGKHETSGLIPANVRSGCPPFSIFTSRIFSRMPRA